MNNETNIIKGRLDTKIYSIFKTILNKTKMTQQEFIEQKVKDFIVDNIELVIDTNSEE